jgi:Na+-translocating membrane potential-generating system (MpsC)
LLAPGGVPLRQMQPAPGPEPQLVHLGEDALAAVAVDLALRYEDLYGERPLDPRASLNGNLLAWVFDDGLSTADEKMLRRGREDSLRKFRHHFFDAAGERLQNAVGELTGVPINYSFFGFDPPTRTTHGVFVLDLSTPDFERRQALIGWSEQVRRNAVRLRKEHAVTSETNRELTRQVRAERERFARRNDPDDGKGPA